jgi:phosphoenolpyruvate---glycerone phosphotransferase subunit DhaK
MKKFMNSAGELLGDTLYGLEALHEQIVAIDPAQRFVMRRSINKDKVALISGGGSGHEPLHSGFVGYGMLDAACPGQVFTSPTPDQMLAAVDAVSGKHGTLFVVKNYEGDVMNFDMACEMLDGNVARIVIDDDVSVQTSMFSSGRRGVAGTMIVEKVVGAAAEQGRNLLALKGLGDRVNAQTRSMGVAFSSCTVPAAGSPTFTLAEHEMEMGVGIHGEPGLRRVNVAPADTIADEMINAIISELNPRRGQSCLLLVNGFGGTPLSELYVMAGAAKKALTKRGVAIARGLAGSYVTSLEMVGCSLTVTLFDEETLKLWDAAVHTPALRWGV